MMKVEDLFVGAIVEVNAGFYAGFRFAVSGFLDGSIWLRDPLGGDICITDASYCDPVRLTTEHLVDWFGFEHNKTGMWTPETYSSRFGLGEFRIVDWGLYCVFLHHACQHARIEYVHELQRAYHSIVGEPLRRDNSAVLDKGSIVAIPSHYSGLFLADGRAVLDSEMFCQWEVEKIDFLMGVANGLTKEQGL